MVSTVPALVPAAALVLGAATLSPAPPAPHGSTTVVASPVPAVSPAAARSAPLPPGSSPAPPLPPAASPGGGKPADAGTRPLSGSSPALRAGWQWPLRPEPEVTRRFQRPASTWGPGHRGVDLAAAPGQPVLAAAAGRVTHVGVVAGRGTVSVLHAGGVRTTYEPVSPRVGRGDTVRSGEVIGVVAADGRSHCTACLHVGAVRGRIYLDPLVLLRPGRVVLLPLGGR